MKSEGDNDAYHTPLILRTGYLHSYTITIAAAAITLVVSILVSAASGVLDRALLDPWNYFFLFMWLFAASIVRQVVSGFDQLFDIFDSEFDKKVKLYTSLDTPQSESQERIASLFVDAQRYEEFKESIRRMLFSRGELVLLSLYALLNVAILLAYVITHEPSQIIGVYGVDVWPYGLIGTVWLFGFYSLVGYFVISALWLIVSMIRSVSLLEKHRSGLKVTEYAHRLQHGEPFEAQIVMGFDRFYAWTSPIGQFLYDVTFKVMLLIVGLALYFLAMRIVMAVPMDITGYIFGVACVALTLILFIWSQLGLHRVLAKTKSQIKDALLLRQEDLNTQVLGWATQESISDAKALSSKVNLQKTALHRIDCILVSVDHGPTWSFRMPTALKLILTSLTPLLIALGQFLLRQYIPSP